MKEGEICIFQIPIDTLDKARKSIKLTIRLRETLLAEADRIWEDE